MAFLMLLDLLMSSRPVSLPCLRALHLLDGHFLYILKPFHPAMPCMCTLLMVYFLHILKPFHPAIPTHPPQTWEGGHNTCTGTVNLES